MATLQGLKTEQQQLEEWLGCAAMDSDFAGKQQPKRWQKRLDAVNGDIAQLGVDISQAKLVSTGEPGRVQNPHDNIMGVERTEPGPGAVLDWLQGTLCRGEPADVGLSVVEDVFGDIEPRGRGMSGYVCSGTILNGLGRVAWNDDLTGRADMGVLVVLGSQALAELARRGVDVLVVLKALVEGSDFRASRIDFALDDRGDEGVLDIQRVCDFAYKGHYTSPAQKDSFYRDNRVVTGVTFGSRTSEQYLRIYDKAKERLEKTGEKVEGHWVRVELELKGRRAHAALLKCLEEGVAFVVGLVRRYLKFRAPSVSDTNMRRWAVCEWWERFLSYAEDCVLRLPDVVRTLDDVKAWIERQSGPLMAVVAMSFGGVKCDFDGWLSGVLARGRVRWKAKHRVLLEEGAAF